MKKTVAAMLLAFPLITIVGCNKESESTVAPTVVPSSTKNNETTASTKPSSSAEPTPTEDQTSGKRIQIIAGEHVVTFQLNDSTAAQNLYAQLPLSLKIENYSSNEKIFYPPQPLDISDAPQAGGGFGVLAYYAPWGDVILFYDDFSPNGSLYELGQAVSGSEHIQSIEEGTITIESVP
ncbi:cyclophilin-like fold protein [Cohnella sp. 56]|uniref:cyclophilin-like fold protein n=1 Tax=Cohnella sp. 56 TaxID=3113722 RepID=UPI0030E7964E